ncbi:hypothetical protein [Arthrobacter mobilis]|uniref:Uncharacterized protein n=1 Tax=Arthrobacter mobilis TaxID=2724944 RepID=A0A7X6K7N7_9MICC|nr:hypothetical protein [Arthrobacter mobilis]NKX56668.1 hypothetical protein [Arthrobacter mobilis]
MNTETDTVVEVKVRDRFMMDRCLDAAVDRMIDVALLGRSHGILVTRLGHGHFTVGLSDAVPFGCTEQLDARTRSF